MDDDDDYHMPRPSTTIVEAEPLDPYLHHKDMSLEEARNNHCLSWAFGQGLVGAAAIFAAEMYRDFVKEGKMPKINFEAAKKSRRGKRAAQ